jgi:hypothetical protein
MEKQIAELTHDPHTVSLSDRKCSLFIDPKSGSIFVDEGDGGGRMNGVVFSLGNGPSFTVQPTSATSFQLLLEYSGTKYVIGNSNDGNRLRSWAAHVNLFLTAKAESPTAAATMPPGPANGARVTTSHLPAAR